MPQPSRRALLGSLYHRHIYSFYIVLSFYPLGHHKFLRNLISLFPTALLQGGFLLCLSFFRNPQSFRRPCARMRTDVKSMRPTQSRRVRHARGLIRQLRFPAYKPVAIKLEPPEAQHLPRVLLRIPRWLRPRHYALRLNQDSVKQRISQMFFAASYIPCIYRSASRSRSTAICSTT